MFSFSGYSLNSLDEDAQNQIQGISMNLLKILD